MSKLPYLCWHGDFCWNLGRACDLALKGRVIFIPAHPRITPTPTTVKFVFLRSDPDSAALLASARESLSQGHCRVVHLHVARRNHR